MILINLNLNLNLTAGSYSESAGVEVIRRHVADYIEHRDGGVASDYNDVFLSNGASEGIRVRNYTGTAVLRLSVRPRITAVDFHLGHSDSILNSIIQTHTATVCRFASCRPHGEFTGASGDL